MRNYTTVLYFLSCILVFAGCDETTSPDPAPGDAMTMTDAGMALDMTNTQDAATSISDADIPSDMATPLPDAVMIPDGAILPGDNVSQEETGDESCPNTCILADGTCAPEDATSNEFCGRPGESCLASCNSCEGRYDSLNFPTVYEMPPADCDDCVSFERFCDGDGNGEVDPEKAGVGVTLCMGGAGGAPPGMGGGDCMISTPAECPCDCCPSCDATTTDGVQSFQCGEAPAPTGVCVMEGPSSGVASWIEPFPFEGPGFETIFTDVTDDFCRAVEDLNLGSCTNATETQLSIIFASIRLALKTLALTANNRRPPQTMLTPEWTEFVNSKQYRSITRLNKTVISCNQGIIQSAFGQDLYYDNHGYTPVPTNSALSYFSAGEGRSIHVYPDGTPIGRQCLKIRHEHHFYISGLGGIGADFLSGPFDVPIPYHLFETELCCPAEDSNQGRYSLELEASNFPSHQAYLDDQATRLRFQDGLGDFMFSSPDNQLRLPPGSELTSVQRDVECIPVQN